MDRARILLADDHEELRDQLVLLLQTEFEVVGAVENGKALLKAESKLRPDVCVIDISMPGICGIDAASELRARGSGTKIVMLTTYDGQDSLAAALESGAAGYVIKSRVATDLCKAIHDVLAGRQFISNVKVRN